MSIPESQLKDLMLRSMAGDEAAYRSLLDAIARLVRGHVGRLLSRARAGNTADAEDIVQDVLIAVHTRRHTYDAAYPVGAWVHAIARHKVIDHLRARARTGSSLPIDDLEDLLPAPEEAADAVWDVARVLDRLPPALRSPFAAVKLEGRSIAEAARTAGMSETALKVAIHRGMKRLSRIFGSGNGVA
ncbi:sigma-70 family RNA polymerase sigma factor [Prosthecodimorpha staleyi]|uniref:Sigma-70 family RNA polymerase sigma factor n=1 Tax=Prosthecodimorpha staleyi TaxID=2840188 RepID=A0A947D1W6_9HYPH|nr:sigma-70 family RNA polymerase sigma factor [Prosthecodimorpha staleyi]MBT9288086.1 sigma-70 family RNA polymerase sigma factor [Prosthecodimorpha staleyi]